MSMFRQWQSVGVPLATLWAPNPQTPPVLTKLGFVNAVPARSVTELEPPSSRRARSAPCPYHLPSHVAIASVRPICADRPNLVSEPLALSCRASVRLPSVWSLMSCSLPARSRGARPCGRAVHARQEVAFHSASFACGSPSQPIVSPVCRSDRYGSVRLQVEIENRWEVDSAQRRQHLPRAHPALSAASLGGALAEGA